MIFVKNPVPGKCKVKFCRRKTRCKSGTICTTCQKKLWRINNPMKAAYATLKYNVARRNRERPDHLQIPFDLTFTDFKAFCYKYKYMKGKGKTAESYSIDRINDDPARGYFGYRKDNIQVLKLAENTRKRFLKTYYDDHKKTLWARYVVA